MNNVTERFIHAHRQELSTIADKHADEGERKKAILKRGGAGFLGGTTSYTGTPSSTPAPDTTSSIPPAYTLT
jgi:hypothetical protein